ncbi:hypothetical protein [uncultured Desulfovibrio sp.]|uniref:LPD3 domain-containing protein n=1 Tax=uncultured Desulfovibrio sp. TaxID=167968 RepID=UPI0026312E7A|nr:hypothetical protein [uncultured Desulfovibrio sp.]
MTRNYEEIAEGLFGVSPQQSPQPAPLEAEGAVDTSGGINAALSISPSETQQNVRKAILNPVQMGNPDGMTAMSASDDSWKDALAGTLNDYGMGDAVDLYGNAKVGPQLQAEPPTLAEDPNAKLREQMMEREATRSALRPLDGDAESGLVRATFMLNAASKHSQGDAMSAWQLSQKLDMPFEVTLDNLAAARLAGSEIVPDDIKSFAPAFLRLVQYDYDAAILWRHDLATANAVAEAFSPVDAVADTFVPMPNDDFDHTTRGAAIGRGVAKGGLGIAQALFTLGKAGIEGLGQAEGLGQRMAEGIASTIKPDALPVDKPATEPPVVSQWFGDMAQAATKAMGDVSEDAPYAGKAIWDNPEVMLDSRWWLENGISTTMSSLPAMAAYAAKGGLAAGATGFVMEAANAYNDMIADGLPDDFRTRAYAAVYGVVAGALEATGTASMFGGIPTVKAVFKKMLTGAAKGGVKQAVKHSAAHVGMGLFGEGGTEWLQNIAQGGLESAAKGNTGEQIFNDVLASAKELENLVLGGVFGGAMAGVHSRAEVRGERFNADIAESIRRASNAPEMVAAREEVEAITRESEAAQSRMAFAQSLEKAATAADSSTVHQTDPALFEQEAAKLIPEEARAVWLDVATVQEFTQGDPARLEALGLKQQDIEDAVSTGATGVQVPTMAIVARFQGEERQTLMQSARPEPGGMTQEEAQSFDPAARSEEAANRIRSVSQTSSEVNKEKTRLKQEFVQAGYPAHMAEYYATLHAAQARAFADRYGLDPVHELRKRSVVQVNPEEVAAGALHHPLNAGVNLEAPVRVVTVQPQFAGQNAKVLRKRFPKNLKDTVLAQFKNGVVNEQTGQQIGMSSKDFQEHLKFDDTDTVGGLEQLEAIAVLPELMREAKQVESYTDKKSAGSIKQMHRFQAALRIGEKDYSVKLTVKEYKDGSLELDAASPLKVYHHRLEKEMPAGNSTALSQGDQPPQPSAGIHEYSLRSLLEDVNDSEGNRFLQGSRGAVSFGASGDSITSIFKDASDPSTPIHEGAHVFINDLIRVVADGGRMLETDFHQRISANNADAKAGTIDEKLRKRRERAITQNYETRRRNIHWTARGDLEALVANANAQREAHGKAIGEDLVEVPLEAALNGSLTPEQMKTLQEVNATGLEAYVREGNAPSDALRGVFHRMKEWLKAIYRALTVNGVKPTPEVARVFDRMLATDAAIDSSKAGAAMSNEAEFFEAINGLGDAEWSKKDRINYKAALNKEGDEFQRLHELYNLAEAEVSARMDKEALKERNQRWKGYYAEGKEIAQDDVFYDVIAALTAKTDVSFSGISREWLERMYGKGAVADLRKTAMGRKIINSEGGMPLDAVGIADIVGNSDRAEAMGLSDADGLYNYLYDNIVVRQRSLARDAKAYADQRLADDDRQAEKTADVPGEAYRKYLDEVEATVLRMAAREGAAWRTPEQQARWIEQNRLTLATVRRQVREVLRGKPLRDIMPNMYVGEVRAALQDRNAALLAGNARDALAAVDRARTALESWIEANRIIKEREAFEKQAARLAVVKRDVIAPEAYTAIQDLLERFQTVPKRAFRDTPKPLQEVVDNLAAASGAVQSGPAVAEWLLTSAQEVNYKDLNVEQLQDVKDLLAMLERTGRDVLASNKASEAARVKEVADTGADSMAGLKPDILAAAGSALRGWQDWNRKFFSSFAAVQWQMRQADGFTNLGPKGKHGVNEMRIYGAIVEGESRREVRMRALTDRLAPVFQRLAESAKRMEMEKGKAFMGANNKPLAVPESMRQISRNNWTADNVIAMALNLGNEGNATRLREGFPDLKPEVLAQLLGDDAARLVFKNWTGKGHEGLLSAKDWRDIQEIWDTLHTQWSDIRATHERLYGFKPRGVEAREITLSIDGKAITLPGGYYPAVYDPQLSKEVAGRNEKQDALARGEAMYAVPAARKGFTQGRANSGGGLPLMLSTGVVMSHLNDVTRFIELAETVRFADRVTQSPQWAQAYTAAFGKAQYDAIRPNLKNIVLEDRPPMDAFSIAAEKARAHLIPWGLGWNFKTALLQSTALFPAMNDIGAANVMRGVSALGIGRYALVKEIWENSPYMKSRASNIDQDLRQAVKSIDERTRQKAVKLLGAEVTWDKVVEAGMLPLLTVDMATSSAIWLAAYNKEMGSLMDGPAGKNGIDPSSEYHKAAVLAADMAVKAVNPDFNPSSRSAFLRDRGVVRLLNMFSSAVVRFAQRRAYNAQALKQAWHKAGKDKAARLSAVGSYARYEAYDFLLPAVAMGLLQSLAGGSDDPDKWGKSLRSAYLDSFAMRLPVAGGVISSLITNETWRGMSTVFEQPVRMGQRLAGAIHQGNEEKMVGAMADALSFLTKIPVSRVVRSGMRGYDQWQRGEGTPLSLVMPSAGK